MSSPTLALDHGRSVWRIVGDALVLYRRYRVLPVVMAAEIVANLGIYLGFLLVIPGIILALLWSVTAQAAAVEHEGWMPALSSSGRLTSGNCWRIVGLFMLIGPPIIAINLEARALPLGGSSGIGSVVLGVAINTMIASFGALVLALLYFDLRARGAAPAARRLHEYEHVRVLRSWHLRCLFVGVEGLLWERRNRGSDQPCDDMSRLEMGAV